MSDRAYTLNGDLLRWFLLCVANFAPFCTAALSLVSHLQPSPPAVLQSNFRVQDPAAKKRLCCSAVSDPAVRLLEKSERLPSVACSQPGTTTTCRQLELAQNVPLHLQNSAKYDLSSLAERQAERMSNPGRGINRSERFRWARSRLDPCALLQSAPSTRALFPSMPAVEVRAEVVHVRVTRSPMGLTEPVLQQRSWLLLPQDAGVGR